MGYSVNRCRLGVAGYDTYYWPVTSGPASGRSRGRVPVRMGRMMAAGWPGFLYVQRGDKEYVYMKTAVYRGGRWYLRTATPATTPRAEFECMPGRTDGLCRVRSITKEPYGY